jgi:hypothetical protein
MRFLPKTPENVRLELVKKLDDALQLDSSSHPYKIYNLNEWYYFVLYPDWLFILSKKKLKALLSEFFGKVDFLEIEFNPLSVKGTSFVIGSKEAKRVAEC